MESVVTNQSCSGSLIDQIRQLTLEINILEQSKESMENDTLLDLAKIMTNSQKIILPSLKLIEKLTPSNKLLIANEIPFISTMFSILNSSYNPLILLPTIQILSHLTTIQQIQLQSGLDIAHLLVQIPEISQQIVDEKCKIFINISSNPQALEFLLNHDALKTCVHDEKTILAIQKKASQFDMKELFSIQLGLALQ